MTDLLARVLDAHGGTRRWSEVTTLRAEMSVTGPLWGLKGWPGGLGQVTVEIATREQRSVLSPFTDPGLRSVFHVGPERLRIETVDGVTVQRRDLPRDSFAGFTRATPWDRLHLAYFLNYGLWNYLTTPFLLTYPGVHTHEVEPWTEGEQTWRRLHVEFPTSIATHSAHQTFYFDADFRQRRMDYAPQVIGSDSHAAHLTSDYRSFEGILLPTRRRVYPRDPLTDAYQPEQEVIALDVHAVELF